MDGHMSIYRHQKSKKCKSDKSDLEARQFQMVDSKSAGQPPREGPTALGHTVGRTFIALGVIYFS